MVSHKLNDWYNAVRREIAALDVRYQQKFFMMRDPKHRLPPLRDSLMLTRPAPRRK